MRHYNMRRKKSSGSFGRILFFLLFLGALVGVVQYYREGWPFHMKGGTFSQKETGEVIPLDADSPRAVIPLPEEKNPEVVRKELETALPNLAEVSGASMWIRIVKSRHTMFIYDGPTLVRSYPIGVGKNKGDKKRVGDCRTPQGSFEVQQIQQASRWTHDFGDGKGPIEGAYGPWFIRIKAGKWKGIGIHGTHDPSSIGKDITEGCIRLTNKDLQELKPKIVPGMKVVIEP